MEARAPGPREVQTLGRAGLAPGEDSATDPRAANTSVSTSTMPSPKPPATPPFPPPPPYLAPTTAAATTTTTN